MGFKGDYTELCLPVDDNVLDSKSISSHYRNIVHSFDLDWKLMDHNKDARISLSY